MPAPTAPTTSPGPSHRRAPARPTGCSHSWASVCTSTTTAPSGGVVLYSTSSEDISQEDVAVAAFFATHASLALGKARHVETLNGAIATRQLVGQAIGILCERHHIDDQAAQAFLWRTSSHSNTKVRAVATHLVDEVNARRTWPGGRPGHHAPASD